MKSKLQKVTLLGAGVLVSGAFLGRDVARSAGPEGETVTAKLSEWKIELSRGDIPAGPVTFQVLNLGTIPHAFELESEAGEHETQLIQPGSSARLTLSLKPGRYEVYCPVGGSSHKKLGMEAELMVGQGSSQPRAEAAPGSEAPTDEVKEIEIRGGGPVIQILPGPFPFSDSAASVLKQFGPEEVMLKAQEQNGPYSNRVAQIAGRFTIQAWDRGATGDSVAGLAEFTTRNGTHWKLVVDRVQTQDVAHHPRFGGVIMGLYYHGATGVHTPLVPTINSAVALWAYAHLYRNANLVTDSAMVHVMQLSRTRRPGDFALSCWDCSKNPVEELQLQVTPPPGAPQFDAPGGFLFVNWERSSSHPGRG